MQAPKDGGFFLGGEEGGGIKEIYCSQQFKIMLKRQLTNVP